MPRCSRSIRGLAGALALLFVPAFGWADPSPSTSAVIPERSTAQQLRERSAEIRKSERYIASVASDWLGLLDRGQYDEAWEGSWARHAGLLDKATWIAAATRQRRPYGRQFDRRIRAQTLAPRDTPERRAGPADAPRVTIWFDSIFEDLNASEEVLVLRQTQEGDWLASDYSSRPKAAQPEP